MARCAALAKLVSTTAVCLSDAALEIFPTTDLDAARVAGDAEVRTLGGTQAEAWWHQRRCVDPAGRLNANIAGLRTGSGGGRDRHGPLGRWLWSCCHSLNTSIGGRI
mmetsp:Transcript_42212/g.82842  ORF Transcript_42212/g.82842 Transcript_42212/m.82842 type:complete len:107 (-) Transcript_42212:522-842(-)